MMGVVASPLSVHCVLYECWEEGCKRYPCLLPTCPTLRLLHPGRPGKEWGSPGNRTGQGGGVGGV